MPISRATLWAIVAPYLLLPAGLSVDLPLLPPLDKASVPNVAAYFACWLLAGKRVTLLPRLKLARILMFIFIASPFVTVLLNPDPIIAGATFIKGMEYWDAFSAVIRQVLFMLPFAMGAALFRTEKDLENIFRILTISGLLYSLPMLIEIRMSPQLNRWIYGFLPDGFLQNIRGEGFRPVVFVGHGLYVAYFTMITVVSAATLHRIRVGVLQLRSRTALAIMSVMLLLCKSMGSVIYAAIILPLIYLARPTRQVKIARVLVIIAVTYPLLRMVEWVPIHSLVDVASNVSAQRAQSLNFRFENDEKLLAKVMQRPIFGWGSWGRNRLYDEKTGRDISVTDGRWIITVGTFGLAGYLAEFGLLALPVFLCARIIKKVESRRERVMLAALNLLLAINMIDLLPNATVTPFSWMLAGILFGYSGAVKGRDASGQKNNPRPLQRSLVV